MTIRAVACSWAMLFLAADARTADSDCANAAADIKQSNAPSLFSIASRCFDLSPDDAHLLLIAAQVRGMVDLQAFRPEKGETSHGELAGNLFHFGGVGIADWYRNKSRAMSMFERLESLRFAAPDSYSPGWRYLSRPTEQELWDLYAAAMRVRVAQLKDYLGVVADDEYARLTGELASLSQAGASGVSSAADVVRVQEIYRRMDEIAAMHRQHVDALPAPKRPEPPEDADFDVVYRGWDGPDDFDALVFTSASAVRQSWIGETVERGNLEDILARTDFSQEIIAVVSVGARRHPSGSLVVAEFEPALYGDGMSLSVQIGIADQECSGLPAAAAPFAIVRAPKPGGELNVVSKFVSNFPDECLTTPH